MERSDKYRRFARECLEMAQTVASECSRLALIHMAEVWLRLAEVPKSNEEGHDC